MLDETFTPLLYLRDLMHSVTHTFKEEFIMMRTLIVSLFSLGLTSFASAQAPSIESVYTSNHQIKGLLLADQGKYAVLSTQTQGRPGLSAIAIESSNQALPNAAQAEHLGAQHPTLSQVEGETFLFATADSTGGQQRIYYAPLPEVVTAKEGRMTLNDFISNSDFDGNLSWLRAYKQRGLAFIQTKGYRSEVVYRFISDAGETPLAPITTDGRRKSQLAITGTGDQLAYIATDADTGERELVLLRVHAHAAPSASATPAKKKKKKGVPDAAPSPASPTLNVDVEAFKSPNGSYHWPFFVHSTLYALFQPNGETEAELIRFKSQGLHDVLGRSLSLDRVQPPTVSSDAHWIAWTTKDGTLSLTNTGTDQTLDVATGDYAAKSPAFGAIGDKPYLYFISRESDQLTDSIFRIPMPTL